ncbi:MAG: PAS domain S-box protein, partial [Desulfobacteraceae bacterium]|nr:PAS domain S-box protein [Desulfobacteraceae bacterium]
IVGCNEAFEELFLYDQSEIEGKTLDELIVGGDQLEKASAYTKTTLTGKSMQGLGQRRRKDGALIDVKFRGIPITVDGEVMGAYGIYEDITALTQAEEVLRESEEKLRAIYEAADNVSFITTDLGVGGKDTRITSFSPGAEKMFGYSEDEVIGKRVAMLHLPGDVGKFPDIMELTKKGEKGYSGVTTLVRRSGEHFPVLFTVHPIFDFGGQTSGALGVSIDISDRVRTEEALREHASMLEKILQSAADGICVCHNIPDEPYVNFTHWNPRMTQITGYTIDQINRLGWHQTMYPDPEVQELAVERMARMREGDDIKAEEWVITTKDGEKKSLSISTSVVTEETGKVHVLAIIQDISERKRAEEALRKSEERYRDLFDSIGDFIYSHDLEGRFITVNRAAANSLGYAPKELIGKPISDFMLPDYRATFKEGYLAQIKEKGSYDGVSIYLSKDGKNHYIEYRNVLVKQDAEEPFVSGAGRDITERVLAQEELRKLEDQLRQAEKMESIGTLAGGIAHDFNNLLMAIQGNASLMLLKKYPTDPDYVRLKNIEEYVQNGAELTKQLLGFAKGGKYEVKPTDLNELIKKSSEMFGRTKKEITIRSKYQKDIWAVEVDRTQVEQVLMNLYINAWQAMSGGGKLFLETESVDLSSDYVKPYGVVPGKYVKISVTDTGVGMDERTRERIFDPFFTTKEMGRGSGLGLASAYGIIKNHGGIINVQSTKGEGTTFTFYLPASEKEVIKEKELPEEVLEGDETILLVDDEDMIIDAGKEMLEEMGYTVLA